MKRLSYIFLITVATIMFVGGAYISLRQYRQSHQQPISTAAPLSSQTNTPSTATASAGAISGLPSHLSLPSVHISLDVMPGYYNKQAQTWTSSITKAVYAATTAPANNTAGNTFIYGHNRPSVFSRLLNSRLGDTAVLTTANGHTFTYTLVTIHDVQPTDLSVLKSQGQPTLSLQTCSGYFYQNRRIFVFNLTKAV